MLKKKKVIKKVRQYHISVPMNLFSFPQYRLLLLISTFINTGRWTFLFIAGWSAYSLTQSSVWPGAIVFAIFAPSLFGAPFIGVILDKINRKKILLLSIFFSALFNLILALLSFNGSLSIITLFILALFYGTAISILGVSINTLLPSSVPAKKLFVAVHLQSIAQNGTEFIGPAIATILMTFDYSSIVYLFTMVLYGIAMIFGLFLSLKHSKLTDSNQSVGFLAQMKEGIIYVLNTKSLFTIISLTSFHCILTMSYTGLLPTFVNKFLNKNTEFYGNLLTYTGLGAIFGILILTLWNKPKQRNTLLYWSALVSALSLITLSGSLNSIVVQLSVFLAGFSQGIFMTLAVAIIQELTQEEYRGRVNSVYVLTTTGFMSLFNLLYGTIATYFSIRLAFGAMGGLFLLILILYKLTNPLLYKIKSGPHYVQEV